MTDRGSRSVENRFIKKSFTVGSDGDDEHVEEADHRVVKAVDHLGKEKVPGTPKVERKRNPFRQGNPRALPARRQLGHFHELQIDRRPVFRSNAEHVKQARREGLGGEGFEHGLNELSKG